MLFRSLHGYKTIADKTDIPVKNADGKDVNKDNKNWLEEFDNASPIYILYRTNDSGKAVDIVGVSQSWADTQAFAEADAPKYDKQKEDKAAAVEKQKAENQKYQEDTKKAIDAKWAKEAKDKLDNHIKYYNELQDYLASGKDHYGNDLPEGWSVDKSALENYLSKYTPEYMQEKYDNRTNDQAFARNLYNDAPEFTPQYFDDIIRYSKDDGTLALSAEIKNGKHNLYLGVPGSYVNYKETRGTFDNWNDLVDGVPAWYEDVKKKAIDNAIKYIEPYDKDGSIRQMVKDGKSYDEIHNALENSGSGWKETDPHKWAIDLPTQAQKQA